MKKLALLHFLTAFFLFKPFQIHQQGMLYGGDDTQYLAFATSLVFFQYPSFAKEYVDEFSVPPLSRVGTGFMLAPFVGAFSLLDRLARSPVVERRTRESLVGSWTLYGAFFGVAFYFWMSLCFLFRGLRRFVDESTSLFAILAMVVCQGVGLYAFRRPVFSHVNDLFLQSAFFCLFAAKSTDEEFRKRLEKGWFFPMVALLSMGVMLVRQEGAVFALAWCLVLFYPRVRAASLHFLLAFAFHWLLKTIPYLLDPVAYAAVNAKFETAAFMFRPYSAYFYLKRLWVIFVGWDWGLLFTAPMLLVGLLGLREEKMPQKKSFRFLSLVLLIPLYLLVVWKSHGGWYGYRYLLFPAIPVLILPFAVLVRRLRERRSPWFWALSFWLIVPSASMWVFEHGPSVGLSIASTEFEAPHWSNARYQLEVWGLLWKSPFEFAQALLKGGPAYVLYALARASGAERALPAKLAKLYGDFNVSLFLKSVLLYAMPFLTIAFGKLIRNFIDSVGGGARRELRDQDLPHSVDH